ncbi:TlpA disulfide reductase family protein [Thiomonas sp.]|jgi:thiol-disulfide isomerase/thioredoxin|uniref:TlpA family protein disulfide reductase n=1 Tax=Thiomonas sp. TaxID=2047785 RepID=UPI002609FA76|nr:TlpA disulfide reductase family protein [Thiomonas sp.]
MDALRLGPLVLPWAPLLLVLGYAVAVWVAAWAQKSGRGNAEPALLPLLVLALLVARAVFVLRHAAAYPGALAMLDIRDRGFDALAGWIAAAAGVAFWAWRRPALRQSLPLSAASGAVVVLAATALLQAMQPPRPPLPALTLPTLAGPPLALASLRGQPLVVNLWATWCPPCRRELPLLIAAAQQPDGARIVLVNEGEDAQRVAAYLQRQRLHAPQIVLDPDSRLLAAYRSPGLPTTLFIAADGTVRRVHVGELSAATLQQGIAALR